MKNLLIQKYKNLSLVTEPPKKSPTSDKQSAIWNSFSEILKDSGTSIEESIEVDDYLKASLINSQKGKPFTLWNENIKSYPKLAQLARKY